MKKDTIAQFAKLRQELINEKRQLETRLSQINKVLGSEPNSALHSTFSEPKIGVLGNGRRNRNPMSLREAITQALAKGPLGRKELVRAVENLGYLFNTSDPANSMGVILYAKNSPFRRQDGKFYLPGTSIKSFTPGTNGPAKGSLNLNTKGPRATMSPGRSKK